MAGNKKAGLRIAQAGIFLGTRLFALGSPQVIPIAKQADFNLGARSEVAGNKKAGLHIAQAGIFLGTRLFALGSPAVIPIAKQADFNLGARSEVAGNKKSGLRIAQAGIFLGTRLFALGSPQVIPFGVLPLGKQISIWELARKWLEIKKPVCAPRKQGFSWVQDELRRDHRR